jgi:hypothetical protein
LTVTAEALDDVQLLHAALESIPSSPDEQGAWWATSDGRWLHTRLTERISKGLAASFARRYGATFEPDDVTNTAVCVLARELALASLRRADDQWAYLYQVLRHEMLQQMGSWVSQELDPDRATEVVVDGPDPERVTVSDAVVRTLECLREVTPEPLRAALPEAVSYFAENGDSRLSHLHTRSARDVTLTGLGLSREQILALANIVLGARPNHGDTSLLGGYLRDAHWNPRTSPAHRRALEKYQARMLRATTELAV